MTNYTRLIKMRSNALNWAEWCQAKGRLTLAVRYFKLCNNIEVAMWNFNPINQLNK